MNEREYLEYLKEQSYEAYKSYEYLDTLYENYIFDLQSEDFLKQQRDERIEEILK